MTEIVGKMLSSSRYLETLVVATTNRGKLEELRALAAALPVVVRAAAEVMAEPFSVVEDGATFSENARKKACAVSRATMMMTLADDSGLEVDALAGRPGIHSARFAHPRATDAENNAALLSALEAFGPPAADGGYRARFRCALALVDPFTNGGAPQIVEGTCEGTIVSSPRGSGGFGYDSLLVVDGTGKTMAELDANEKNRLSHRARAFAALGPSLDRALFERAAQIARVP
jgi:XTP/dITP diphosphohydrolase